MVGTDLVDNLNHIYWIINAVKFECWNLIADQSKGFQASEMLHIIYFWSANNERHW